MNFWSNFLTLNILQKQISTYCKQFFYWLLLLFPHPENLQSQFRHRCYTPQTDDYPTWNNQVEKKKRSKDGKGSKECLNTCNLSSTHCLYELNKTLVNRTVPSFSPCSDVFAIFAIIVALAKQSSALASNEGLVRDDNSLARTGVQACWIWITAYPTP